MVLVSTDTVKPYFGSLWSTSQSNPHSLQKLILSDWVMLFSRFPLQNYFIGLKFKLPTYLIPPPPVPQTFTLLYFFWNKKSNCFILSNHLLNLLILFLVQSLCISGIVSLCVCVLLPCHPCGQSTGADVPRLIRWEDKSDGTQGRLFTRTGEDYETNQR